MTPTPDLPCPSKEARELLAAEYGARGWSRSADHVRADYYLNGQQQAALRAIDKALASRPVPTDAEALSRHSASTVDVEGVLYEALKAFIESADSGHVSVEVDKAAREALTTFKSSRLGVRNG